MIGIYKIRNNTNGKLYIGQSNDIERRIRRHKFDLNSGKHINQHLQNSWNLYGEDNFEFVVMEELGDIADLNEREVRLIKERQSFGKGYNATPGGESGYHSFLGKKHSPESRKKMRIARKSQVMTEESNKKRSESLRGKKRKPFTEEHRAKISKAHMGKKHSEEHRAKLSESRKGVALSDSTKEKISQRLTGITRSEETKERISKSKQFKFSEKDMEEIKGRLNDGESYRGVAETFGCSHATLRRRFPKKLEVIKNGKNAT